ncbi:hypothetical protein [Pantoea sp. KPR_PJ]|uniref:hypothetical protein n=1 Tax=Pantoea sp. KPR_PJ TaxID=2738375 RepID=UPI00352996C1
MRERVKSKTKNPFYNLTGKQWVLLAGGCVLAAGVMLILHHRDSVNNALDTGACLADEGVKDFFGMLKHLLHQAYRFVFKACG